MPNFNQGKPIHLVLGNFIPVKTAVNNSNLTVSDLISVDTSNALVLGNDDKLFVNKTGALLIADVSSSMDFAETIDNIYL